MEILIYGATDTAYEIAARLHKEHNVRLIYDAPAPQERFANLDISMGQGSAGDLAILQDMGAGKADLFIACGGLDEANIVACWTVKKIAETYTICFISKAPLYQSFVSEQTGQYQTKYDIDLIVWPEQLLTQDIFRIILVPDALDVEYFSDGMAKLFEYRIAENSPLLNKALKDCSFPKGVLVAGIKSQGNLTIPNGNSVIQLNDKIIFIGNTTALDTLAADIFGQRNKVRSVSIVGGGSVGFMLAASLEQKGIKVKIIETSETRCTFLADSLKKSLVLQGDGTDLELLESEDIAQADVCVCTTNNDEKNLLCSLLIKQLGCTRIITRLTNMQNYRLFEHVGIDVVVSPRASALTEVLNRVQIPAVDVVAVLEGGQGEIMRITVPDDFHQVPLRELKFPVKAVVGIISRKRLVIIPDGDTVIMGGDKLQIFVLATDSAKIQEVFYS